MNPPRNLLASRAVVIVLDDDPAVRNSLKFSLEIEGFTVRLYASSADLLSDRDILNCSCMVIDQKMPGMTGLELISVLRARHVSIPAILVTSDPHGEVGRRAAGVNVPIVEKPLLTNALVDRIREACAPSDPNQPEKARCPRPSPDLC